MAVAFPLNPIEGDYYQNPDTGTYYKWTNDSWNVVCFDNQLSCEPTGTWLNQGEVTNNTTPASGVYWRIIDESNGNAVDGSNATKLMVASGERFPTFVDPPDFILLNDTPFVVAKWDSYQGEHHSIYLAGNQSEFLEDPANSDLDYKFCDGQAYVTLDYFTADQKRQDDAITELEEEFENLLPSLDRGSWRYNEDFTKPPGKFGFRTDSGGLPTAFADVAKIILHKEDDAGEPHGFGDIKVDSYIQLFQDGENDTAIYHVDELPVASGDEFEIEVSFVRAEGDYPSLDELFRFKFYEIVGGDAGAYVLKTGDKMSGALEFEGNIGTDPYYDCGKIFGTADSLDSALTLEAEQNLTCKGTQFLTFTSKDTVNNPDNWAEFRVGQLGFGASAELKVYENGNRTKALINLGDRYGTSIYSLYGLVVTGEQDNSKNLFKTATDTVFNWGDDGVDFISEGKISNLKTIITDPTSGLTIDGKNGGIKLKGRSGSSFGNTVSVDDDIILTWRESGMQQFRTHKYFALNNSDKVFSVNIDGATKATCSAQYFGRIQDDDDIVNKKYVDENSGGVEVRAGAPDAPIPLGKMWFDTTRNALYLKTGS